MVVPNWAGVLICPLKWELILVMEGSVIKHRTWVLVKVKDRADSRY